jgi:putative tryptophan/tyrosine transport system substrate-binding protein
MPTRSRRRFVQGSLALAGLGLLAGCGYLPPQVRRQARIPHIGFLLSSTRSAGNEPNVAAFLAGLRELGYIEGQTITIEYRVAEGREEALPELAADLVRQGVDILLVSSNPAVRAAQQATKTIPIVFAFASDPVAEGLIASLARPGGNATGLTQDAGDESAKRLELLKAVAPSLSRVATLGTKSAVSQFKQTDVAARAMGVQVLSLEAGSPEEVDPVLATAIGGHADGLIVIATAFFAALAPHILDFAAKNHLPGMYAQTNFARAGGLMTYATNMPQNYRRVASYVDRILKGTKPGDLPVERPTTYDFVINLKTAQELGLTIPQTVLQQATEIIQ